MELLPVSDSNRARQSWFLSSIVVFCGRVLRAYVRLVHPLCISFLPAKQVKQHSDAPESPCFRQASDMVGSDLRAPSLNQLVKRRPICNTDFQPDKTAAGSCLHRLWIHESTLCCLLPPADCSTWVQFRQLVRILLNPKLRVPVIWAYIKS